MYTLYIGNKNYSSWSLRPWVLMQALGIAFEERLVPFEEGANWKRFRDFSQSGLVPCLHDGDTVVWDSLAITEYLAEAHPGVWPADREARAWARSVVCEMHSGFLALRSICPMNCGIRAELDRIPKALRRDLHRIDEIWTEGQLQHGGPFLAGRAFSAVDAFYAPVAFRMQSYGLKLGARATAYAGHLLEQSAMRDWYAAALAEPWREAHHEAEITEHGRIVDDLRQPAPGP
ncbi:MAG: glutathione S-transferase family protein [Xanthomonadales bacterium]